MSTHAIGVRPDLDRLLPLLPRQPDNITGDPATGVVSLVYTPDLTAPEQAQLADALATSVSAVAITRAEYAALKSALVVLRTFAGIASGSATNTQRDNAIKALAAVLRAMLRDP